MIQTKAFSPVCLASAAALLVLAGCSSSDVSRVADGRNTYTICLDQRGASRPAVCRGVTPGRLSADQGVCFCNGADRPVQAPVCDRGEIPPPESRAFELARRDAARDGSLVGDSFEGRRMCVPSRTERSLNP